MHRGWITGVAIAGALGTGGAAFAGVTSGIGNAEPTTPSAAAAGMTAQHDVSTAPVTYRVGPAGAVTLVGAGGSLTVASATPGTGWTVASISGPGARVEVEFTDSLQLVTFVADLNGDDVVVSLENVPAPGSTATTAMSVEIVTPESVTAPMPATPPPMTTSAPMPAAPKPAATTAPSAQSGERENGDDHDDKAEHESDHEDHGGEHDDD